MDCFWNEAKITLPKISIFYACRTTYKEGVTINMTDCIFCKIISGEIPSNKLFEDDRCIAFHDIEPKAPTHFLIIPKEHIPSAACITEENAAVVSHIFCVAAKLSKDLNLQNGYRIVSNVGRDAGQTVDHLHFHILAGRNLGWPPG